MPYAEAVLTFSHLLALLQVLVDLAKLFVWPLLITFLVLFFRGELRALLRGLIQLLPKLKIFTAGSVQLVFATPGEEVADLTLPLEKTPVLSEDVKQRLIFFKRRDS